MSFHEESRPERLEVLCDTGQESWRLNKDGSGKEEDPRARQEVEPTDLGEGSEESWRDPVSVLGDWVGGGASHKSSKGFEQGEGRDMMSLFVVMCLSLAMPCGQLGTQGWSSGDIEI